MFRIKICGVTSLADARAAIDAGADVIGLNFYAGSPRFVSVDLACRITAEISRAIGVFVNSSADEINDVAHRVGLQAVQLHGDEGPGLLADIDPNVPVIRACSIGEGGLRSVGQYLDECRFAGRAPAAVLVDAAVQGQFGGTGRTANWAEIVTHRRQLAGLPLALAGGLKPENIRAAIHTVRPDAVDVASGVESSPGVKDPAKIRAFVQAAVAAFAAIET